jgi:hypothetical protein
VARADVLGTFDTAGGEMTGIAIHKIERTGDTFQELRFILAKRLLHAQQHFR